MATEIIDRILSGEKKRRTRNTLKLVGAYLEPDVAKVFDALCEKGGKGTRTEVFNLALRKMFKEKGLL